MKCPECGNVVPANALNCDCGDEFSSKPRTPLDQQDAPKFTLLGDDPDLRLGKAGSGPTEVEKAAFFEVLRESTPRLFITPILLGLNLLVFALMIFSGVSPLEPTGRGWRIHPGVHSAYGCVRCFKAEPDVHVRVASPCQTVTLAQFFSHTGENGRTSRRYVCVQKTRRPAATTCGPSQNGIPCPAGWGIRAAK